MYLWESNSLNFVDIIQVGVCSITLQISKESREETTSFIYKSIVFLHTKTL